MAVSLAGGEGEGLLFEDVMLALESERAGERAYSTRSAVWERRNRAKAYIRLNPSYIWFLRPLFY